MSPNTSYAYAGLHCKLASSSNTPLMISRLWFRVQIEGQGECLALALAQQIKHIHRKL